MIMYVAICVMIDVGIMCGVLVKRSVMRCIA